MKVAGEHERREVVELIEDGQVAPQQGLTVSNSPAGCAENASNAPLCPSQLPVRRAITRVSMDSEAHCMAISQVARHISALLARPIGWRCNPRKSIDQQPKTELRARRPEQSSIVDHEIAALGVCQNGPLHSTGARTTLRPLYA